MTNQTVRWVLVGVIASIMIITAVVANRKLNQAMVKPGPIDGFVVMALIMLPLAIEMLLTTPLFMLIFCWKR